MKQVEKLTEKVIWHRANGVKFVCAKFYLPCDAVDFCKAVQGHTRGWLEFIPTHNENYQRQIFGPLPLMRIGGAK